jgi:hypothetical protein
MTQLIPAQHRLAGLKSFCPNCGRELGSEPTSEETVVERAADS